MNASIHIGPTQDKETVTAIADAIVKILNSGADQKTLRAALETFSHTAEVKMAEVKDVTVRDCYFGIPSDDDAKDAGQAEAQEEGE